jgi:hypothetical protein
MSELAAFNDYEREFTLLTSALPTRINTLLNYESSSDAASSELRRIKGEMSQAKQLAMDMEIAARGIAEPTRRELGNKIRIHKETLATLQKDLTNAEAKFDRSALLGTRAAAGAAPLEFDKSAGNRSRMDQATEKLRGGTNQLGDAQRRLEETIDVGAGIMGELDRNRETLQRVRSNVRGAGCAQCDALQFATVLTIPPLRPLLGWRSLWNLGHCAPHPARHGAARNPEQDRSLRFRRRHARHHWRRHMVCHTKEE